MAALKAVYVKRRQEVLVAIEARLEDALQTFKLREGFDLLSQDAQHQVLEPVREGAAVQTKADVAVPSLHELELEFPERLRGAIDKALKRLDDFRQDQGEKPTVAIELRTSGREIDDAASLDRFLNELREQILKELASGHRVRLR